MRKSIIAASIVTAFALPSVSVPTASLAAEQSPHTFTGNIGLVSQSGALGLYLYAMAAGRGLRFSNVVATGNEADVDVADCIDWFTSDAATRVIVVYFEGCRDGSRLRAAGG